MLIGMAGSAVLSSVFDAICIGRVMDGEVAFHAIDFVIGDMRAVQKLMVVDLIQVVLAIVADCAPLKRHLALPACQVTMATCALNAARICEVVIERYPTTQIEGFGGYLMTSCAGA